MKTAVFNYRLLLSFEN